MVQHKIEASLARAMDQLPHIPFDVYALAPIQKMERHDCITRQDEQSRVKKAPVRRFAVAFACCIVFFVVGIGGYQQHLMIDSYITIDVNPSFEITTNKQDRVLDIKALDADATAFVHEKSFRGKTVDDAVEMLFEQLGKSRYISAERNTVLISVHSKTAKHGTQIEQGLTQHIEKALAIVGVKPHVVYQLIDVDNKKRHEAQTYHTSVGKLQMAKRVKESMHGYSLNRLVVMPMWQLLELFDEVDDADRSDDGTADTDEADEADEGADDTEDDIRDLADVDADVRDLAEIEDDVRDLADVDADAVDNESDASDNNHDQGSGNHADHDRDTAKDVDADTGAGNYLDVDARDETDINGEDRTDVNGGDGDANGKEDADANEKEDGDTDLDKQEDTGTGETDIGADKDIDVGDVDQSADNDAGQSADNDAGQRDHEKELPDAPDNNTDGTNSHE